MSDRQGNLHHDADQWYGDTASIQHAGELGYAITHAGFGDFSGTGPDGKLLWARVQGDDVMPVQSGRAHRLQGSAVHTFVQAAEEAGWPITAAAAQETS